MQHTHLSRRDFFKKAGCCAAGLLTFPMLNWADRVGEELARVTIEQIPIHSQPNRKSDIVLKRKRDDLFPIYYDVEGDSGRNSLWHRVWGGFIHSGYVQRVKTTLNPVLTSIL
jgi:hypothetical protein